MIKKECCTITKYVTVQHSLFVMGFYIVIYQPLQTYNISLNISFMDR